MSTPFLPAPRDQLTGCMWLPRIIAKARRLARGELPADYAARFCHPGGVDGAFLAHFGLSREDVVAAAVGTDEEIVRWFNTRRPDASAAIAAWNHIAVNLGRPGFPMAERLPVALSTTYRRLAGRGFTTVFAVLEADETPS